MRMWRSTRSRPRVEIAAVSAEIDLVVAEWRERAAADGDKMRGPARWDCLVEAAWPGGREVRPGQAAQGVSRLQPGLGATSAVGVMARSAPPLWQATSTNSSPVLGEQPSVWI
jgi:hypothetical protein